ncbi:MAG: hypothetical protein V1911_02225 [Candidatus Micrarchaeota archaeon]
MDKRKSPVRERSFYERMCTKFGSFSFLCPGQPRVSEDFASAIEFLDLKVTARQIIISSRFAALASFIILALVAALAFVYDAGGIYFAVAAAAVPILLLELMTEYPKNKVHMEVLKALGEGPKTLIYLIVPLKKNPNLEEAVKFAAENSEGKIAEDLRDSLWRVWSGKSPSMKEELPRLGAKWGRYSDEFKRALYLIRSSLSEKYDARRLATLDKAIKTALDGMVSKTRQYVSDLFVPTLALFSFGTVLPLMFISMLPVFAFFGIGFANPAAISLILASTLIVIYIYSSRILSRRPSTFSQPDVPELPGMPGKWQLRIFNRNVNAFFFCFVVIVGLGFPGILFLATQNQLISVAEGSALSLFLSNINTLMLLWAITAAVSIFCYFSAMPRKKISDQMRQVDSEVLDAMYHVANRMSENRPAEDALQFASEALPNSETSRIFSETVRMVKRRNITMEQAFFDEKIGTLRHIYSKTFRSIIKLFVTSVRKGMDTASDALFIIVSHFSELKNTEKQLADMLKNSISMMKVTASLFAPIVAGMIITLYQLIQRSIGSAAQQLSALGYDQSLPLFSLFSSSQSVSTELLQLMIGVYMLALAVILTRYVSVIENGPDEVSMKLNMAKILPMSMAVFTVVLIASRKLLGG